jgi:PAS domain S-box-containing protein
MIDITERQQAEAALARERHLLETLLENSQDFIYFKDRESRVLRCSRAVRQRSAFGATDIIGKTDFDLFAEEHARPAFQDEQEIMRTGCPLIGKVEREVTKDGHESWALTSKMPLRNKEGEIVGTFGISKDITAIKQAESALARERHLLEALLENSADCIYFKDRESRILRCSKSQSQRFAGGEPDIIGKTDFDLFTEEHARPAFQDEQEIMRTGCPLIGKVEREVTKDGRESWALTSKMPLRNKEGEIIGTFGISKDISAIKQAEAELERTHKELVQASRLAGMAEVATSVLHNVGNVLNSINVAATLVDERVRKSRVADVRRLALLLEEHAEDRAAFLTSDPKGRMVPDFLSQLAERLDSEQAAVLEEISSLRSNVEHVKEIIAMQQSYARVAGVFENIQLADLLEDTLRMNEGGLARHDVKMARDYNVLPPICTDKHKVLQILVNLVRNAKYACDDSGRSDKQVTLRATSGEGRVRIAVIDNGVGIPPENLTRIFNHGFTTRKDGHGFGLHSGALAAKELGGSLTVHSEGLGLGAVFTLELPCQPPADNQTIIPQDRQRNNVAAA